MSDLTTKEQILPDLTKDLVLSADDIKIEAVPTPEWGGTVYVRTIGGTEKDAFELGSTRKHGKTREQHLDNIRARLCAYCLCDAAGAPFFEHPERDAPALGRKSSAALERIWTVARTLNAMDQKDVDDLTKNSAGGQLDEPPTESR